ncbi:MAG: phosphatase PAP2 family protein [Deltaproteobacteria bacterium]|nr:phosphatase PAP2 family protein [Deltaproteobacteria bacterium]
MLTSFVVLFFDGHIWAFIRKVAPEPPDRALLFISEWGLYVFYLIFAGLLVYALLRKRRDLRNLCIAWVKAEVIFGFAVVRVMKIIFGRARPPVGSGFDFFSLHDRYNSFPSGHAADAFVSGIFLFYLLGHSKYRFVPLLYALVMALLRIIVYEHHPSDVTMGMAIGILGAGLVLFIDKPEQPPAR